MIKETCPELSIERKKDSFLCKAVAVLIYFFNQNFMEAGTFAFNKKVYVTEDIEKMLGSEAGRKAYCATLTHEFTHMLDQKEDSQIGFSLAYLFPQNLAILSLFAFGAFLWTPALCFLVFLVALAPWPAKYRLEYEIRGYAVGYALFEKMFTGSYVDRMWEFTIDTLESPAYYYMTRHRQAHPVNSLIFSQSGPFLYDEIEQIFEGLEMRGHFHGN